MSQVSSERSERVLRARLLLLCVSRSDQFGVGSGPLHGVPYFPFYRLRESMGYSEGKGEERERGRRPGSLGPSPSCGALLSLL